MWIFVPYVFRRYQSGEVTQFLINLATMLCNFSYLRNRSVITHFINFSRTAISNATSDYVTAPERMGQNEVPASRNEERTENKSIPAPKIYLNEAE